RLTTELSNRGYREARLEDYTPPEVVREELDDLVLAAAASGIPVTRLAFPDPLPEHALERAWDRLRAMEAIDDAGYLTDHGRRLFPLPLDPLLAHLITAMPDTETTAAMADLAAALTVDRALLPPLRKEEAAEACGVPSGMIESEAAARRFADFALWTAWFSHTDRPGGD
ncbi:MAG: hypothetical protein ABEJ96_07250, partial [Thiohalorhabdaceae bacterium]